MPLAVCTPLRSLHRCLLIGYSVLSGHRPGLLLVVGHPLPLWTGAGPPIVNGLVDRPPFLFVGRCAKCCVNGRRPGVLLVVGLPGLLLTGGGPVIVGGLFNIVRFFILANADAYNDALLIATFLVPVR